MSAGRQDTGLAPSANAGGLVIVLSSRDGASFISEQLQSIRRQTLAEWTLLVRDDGSIDQTLAILDSLAATEPRLRLIRDDLGNLGPAKSFGVLLQHALNSSASYTALADQDDVWDSDKLERQLNVLRSREAVVGKAVPLLVHSDLRVVDARLHLIHPSFLGFQGLGYDPAAPLQTLLTQNFVTGCTAVVNQALLRAALPLPNVVMHDWWLALCAAALGEILFCPDPTVLYRQHGRNVVGSQWWVRAALDAVLRPVRWWQRSADAFSAAVLQAFALAERVEREAETAARDRESLAVIRDYRRVFSSAGPMQRLQAVRRHAVGPRSVLRYPLVFYARVALWRSSILATAPGDST